MKSPDDPLYLIAYIELIDIPRILKFYKKNPLDQRDQPVCHVPPQKTGDEQKQDPDARNHKHDLK